MSEFRTVKISMDGENIDLKVKKSETILDAALENDIDLPYSCQSGVCTACMAHLSSGKVGWKSLMDCQTRRLMMDIYYAVRHYQLQTMLKLKLTNSFHTYCIIIT